MADILNFKDIFNKNVFITGSNGHLGRKLVEFFAANGANIIAHYREPNEDFINFVEQIRNGYNVNIHCLQLDLSLNPELHFIKDFLSSINIKVLDIVVNNAAVFNNSIVEMMSNDEIDNIFRINFTSQLKLIKILIKFLKKSDGPSIINISSNSSIELNMGDGIYGVSKLAINGMTKVLSKELKNYKIRINAVAPGLMNSAWSDKIGVKSKDEFIAKSSIGRLIESEEVANVVLFLASNVSLALNGQVLLCDGGL